MQFHNVPYLEENEDLNPIYKNNFHFLYNNFEDENQVKHNVYADDMMIFPVQNKRDRFVVIPVA